MAQTLYPNLARDSSIVDRIEVELLPQFRRIRNDRRPLEVQWMRFYKLWSVDRDESAQGYRGRNRVYIPIGRRIIENWTQKLKRDLFPTDQWFEVEALRESFAERTAGLKALFNYFLTKQMHVRRKITPWLRQLVTYGTSPVAIAWKLDERVLPVMKDLYDNDGNITDRQTRDVEKIIQYVGPTFRNVDLFAWYVSPVTAVDVKDAWVCFEEMLVPRARLRELGKQPIGVDPSMGMTFENIEDALNLTPDSSAGEKFQSEQDRLQSKGFSNLYDSKDPRRPVDITEAYWRVNLDDDGLAWWRVTVAGDRIVLRVQKNPFWHGDPPWLAGKFVEVVNEFYGRGLPEVFADSQFFLNDIANQANDALVWSMNPIAVVDAYKVQDPNSIRMRPGAKWLASPDAVSFQQPPTDAAAVGFNAINQTIALMNDVANVAPFAGAGTGGPRSRGRAIQTATGAQLVASENLVQVRDVVENIEDQIFIPMLHMMHTLTVQCLSRPLVLRIAGADGEALIEHKLTAADVVGEYDFLWLGSTNAQNQQVRGQQMINFLQIASKVPPQILAAQNTQIDYGYLMRAIWTDGLGLRNGDRVIRDIERKRSMDPRLENDLFAVGRGDEVIVVQGDNDDQHMAIHQQGLSRKGLSVFDALGLQRHIQEHVASKMAKEIIAQQQAMQQQMQQQVGGPAPNGGAPDMGGGGMNPGRPAQTTSMDDLFRQLPRGGTA